MQLRAKCRREFLLRFACPLQVPTRRVHSTVVNTMLDSRPHRSSSSTPSPNPSNSSMATSLTPRTAPALGTSPTTSTSSTNNQARPRPLPRPEGSGTSRPLCRLPQLPHLLRLCPTPRMPAVGTPRLPMPTSDRSSSSSNSSPSISLRNSHRPLPTPPSSSG